MSAQPDGTLSASSANEKASASRLPPLLAAMRPAEWSKASFVVAPLLFSGQAHHVAPDVRVGLTTIGFCFAASAGYLVNDLRDRAVDRAHPRKRQRPIASGAVSPRMACVAAVILAAAAIAACGVAGLGPVGYLLGYLALTSLYSVYLKTQVIIDVMTIGGCFLLRTLAGASATGVTASSWIIVCTSSVALLLGFTKRRQEATLLAPYDTTTRPVLEHYSLAFLDQVVSLLAGITIVSYLLYTLNSPKIGSRMLPTTIPVLYGVLRYEWLIYHQSESRDAADLVMRDPGMLLAGVSWLALAAGLLYLG